VDAYLESPETFEQIKPALVDELWKVAQRELATGFITKRQVKMNNFLALAGKFRSTNLSVKLLLLMPSTMTATVRQRNVITEGDEIEFYGPGFRHVTATVENLRNEDGERIDRAPNPMELLTMTVPTAVEPGDMIRKNGQA
jgi:putative protease